jgi:NADH:ubiquinone oxidoreductase subunit 5 (subunit L)/multisubunit Na+/H+ antiporter MnhA subunit
MQTNYLVLALVALPLVGFLASLLAPRTNETVISRMALATTGLQFLVVLGFLGYWAYHGFVAINIKETVLYKSGDYEFFIDFYFDRVTAVYLFTGGFISTLIVRYSRYYMHLEDGYQRFFSTILFFYFGYTWTVLAGNFETLFIGWEFLGISSFLLIAFYRNRYLPVHNAVKVFSIYRIGDVGILSAMWASHHLWHENITFLKLGNQQLVHEHLLGHSGTGIFIGLAILLAAAAKSAQAPFSSWLPRAMEGPTPSSAIFYGSLSVHFGVFLLLRTFPFWHEQWVVRLAIGLVGLTTAVIAFFVTRVQATIKTQIAYASIAQIGIMFIELALGLDTLVLIHFAGNAFLRSYQLLVSPSVVSYLIRDQFYHYQPSPALPSSKLRSTLYLLSVKEWYLDWLMTNVTFKLFKQIGKWLGFLTTSRLMWYFIPLYALGLVLYFNQGWLAPWLLQAMPVLVAFPGLLMVFKAFAERNHPRLAWSLVFFSHLSLALAVSFNEHFDFAQTFYFLAGITVAALVGFVCIQELKRRVGPHYDLNQYYGHARVYPGLGLGLLLATLGLMGFPITPAFIGEDLLFSHIHQDQYALGIIVSLSFAISGMALIRVYARLFLGNYILPTKGNPLKAA